MSETPDTNVDDTRPATIRFRDGNPLHEGVEETYPNVRIRDNGWVEYWWRRSGEVFAVPPHAVESVMWEGLGQ